MKKGKEPVTKEWIIKMEEIKSAISSQTSSILLVITFFITFLTIRPIPNIFQDYPYLKSILIGTLVVFILIMWIRNFWQNKLEEHFESQQFKSYWWRNGHPIFSTIAFALIILWILNRMDIFFYLSFLFLLLPCFINFLINNFKMGSKERMKKKKEFMQDVLLFLRKLEDNYDNGVLISDLEDEFEDYDRIVKYLKAKRDGASLIIQNKRTIELNDNSLDQVRKMVSNFNKENTSKENVNSNITLSFALVGITLLHSWALLYDIFYPSGLPPIVKFSLILSWIIIPIIIFIVAKRLMK